MTASTMLESVLWLIAAGLWGYLIGRAVGALLNWLQTSTTSIRIPFVTSAFNGLMHVIEWYFQSCQAVVNGLAGALECVLLRRAR